MRSPSTGFPPPSAEPPAPPAKPHSRATDMSDAPWREYRRVFILPPHWFFLVGFLLARFAGLIRELLACKRSGIHQAALGDRKYRHAVVVDAIGVGVSLSRARAGGDAVGAYAGVPPGGNRDRTCAGREFKVAGLELVQRALVLKKEVLREVFA